MNFHDFSFAYEDDAIKPLFGERIKLIKKNFLLSSERRETKVDDDG